MLHETTTHRMYRIIAGALLFVVVAFQATAQEVITIDKNTAPDTVAATTKQAPIVSHRVLSLSALGGYALDFNSAANLTLPDVPTCCPGYNGATGGGFVGGLGVELPISDKFELVTRLTYHSTSVTQTTAEPITVRDGNSVKDATITHDLTSTMSIISLEPAIMFRVSEGFGLIGGLRLGSLMSATYEQKERLDESIPYDYADGSGVRNSSSGDISQTSAFQFGLVLGARYSLTLNASRSMHLVPEIQFSPLFTSLISGQSWNVNSLRFMLGFTYDLISSKHSADPLAPR